MLEITSRSYVGAAWCGLVQRASACQATSTLAARLSGWFLGWKMTPNLKNFLARGLDLCKTRANTLRSATSYSPFVAGGVVIRSCGDG